MVVKGQYSVFRLVVGSPTKILIVTDGFTVFKAAHGFTIPNPGDNVTGFLGGDVVWNFVPVGDEGLPSFAQFQADFPHIFGVVDIGYDVHQV